MIIWWYDSNHGMIIYDDMTRGHWYSWLTCSYIASNSSCPSGSSCRFMIWWSNNTIIWSYAHMMLGHWFGWTLADWPVLLLPPTPLACKVLLAVLMIWWSDHTIIWWYDHMMIGHWFGWTLADWPVLILPPTFLTRLVLLAALIDPPGEVITCHMM